MRRLSTSQFDVRIIRMQMQTEEGKGEFNGRPEEVRTLGV
jgi:hypothetical protein